jgi:hypothetical protein
LDTALSIRVSLEKEQNFLFIDTRPFKAVKEPPIAHLAAEFLNTSEEFLAIAAHSPKKS